VSNPASTLALGVLVLLAVASPWPFGSAHPFAIRVVSVAALAAVVASLLVGAVRGGLTLPAVPLWPALAFLVLGALQLVPLPSELHARVAPASAQAWHPSEAAAAVLGSGPRPVSVDPATTLGWLGLAGGLVALAVLAAPALARPRTAARAASIVVASTFALAAYGIFSRTLFGPLLYGRYQVPTVSPFGPFVSKNHFAGYVAMATLLSLGLALGLSERPKSGGSTSQWAASSRASGAALAMLATLAMALAVLVSFSRGGALALLGGCFAFVAAAWVVRRSRRRQTPAVPALALGLTLAVLLVAVLPQEAQDRIKGLVGAAQDQSGSFRLDTWSDVVGMAKASPWLGHGMGSFHDAFTRYKRGHGEIRVEHAENDYLETLAEGGIVGLCLALLAAALLSVRSLGEMRGSPEPLLAGLGLGAVGGLGAVAVHSALDFSLRIPSNAVLAALLAAVAAGAAGTRRAPLPRLAAAAAAIVVGIALGALCLAAPSSAATADRAVRAAVSTRVAEARALRLAQAEDALRSTLRRRPAHAESWLRLAWTRAARGDAAGARELARHAMALDPQRPDLRTAAQRLIGGPGEGR
jgi:O-antigen ligase